MALGRNNGGGGGGHRSAGVGMVGAEDLVVREVADFGLLTFVRAEGSGEWNYPWDLTGGLYRSLQKMISEKCLRIVCDSQHTVSLHIHTSLSSPTR